MYERETGWQSVREREDADISWEWWHSTLTRQNGEKKEEKKNHDLIPMDAPFSPEFIILDPRHLEFINTKVCWAGEKNLYCIRWIACPREKKKIARHRPMPAKEYNEMHYLLSFGCLVLKLGTYFAQCFKKGLGHFSSNPINPSHSLSHRHISALSSSGLSSNVATLSPCKHHLNVTLSLIFTLGQASQKFKATTQKINM